MARIHVPYPLTGSIGGLVFYQRKDSNGRTFVRQQGGVAPGRPRNDTALDIRQRNASEMRGRAAMAVDLRRVLHALEPVRTGNWQSALSGALRPVQVRDTGSVFGERAVLLSRYGSLLAGYSLNKHTRLEALVRSPLEHHLDKSAGSAVLRLPELVAGANWQVPKGPSWARWVAVLGAVPDQLFVPGRGYTPAGDHPPVVAQTYYSEWHPVKGGAPALAVDLRLAAPPPASGFALVLAAGIVMGAVNGEGTIEALGYAGAGKILGVQGT